jgi:membrane protease YdiL (CAAX protease family)
MIVAPITRGPTIALSVIITWMYNSTGGSLLLVALLHAAFNLPLTILIAPLGSQETLAFSLYVGLLVVAAIVVVIWAGPAHLSRKHQKQEEKKAETPEAPTPTVPPVPHPTTRTSAT